MPIENGLARITTLSHYKSGQAISNTVHIAQEGSGSPPDLATLTALATDWAAYFGPLYEGILTSTDVVDQVTVSQVANPADPDPVLEAVKVISHVGTGTTDARTTPDSIAGLLSWKTPVAGKRFRGHIFPPGSWAPTNMKGDVWDPSSDTWLTNLDHLADGFRAGITGAVTPWTGTELPDWSLVVFSPTAAAEGVASVSRVSAVVRSNVIRWLRSRERGAS